MSLNQEATRPKSEDSNLMTEEISSSRLPYPTDEPMQVRRNSQDRSASVRVTSASNT